MSLLGLGDRQLVKVLQGLSHLLWTNVVNWMGWCLHMRTRQKNCINCSIVLNSIGLFCCYFAHPACTLYFTHIFPLAYFHFLMLVLAVLLFIIHFPLLYPNIFCRSDLVSPHCHLIWCECSYSFSFTYCTINSC